MSGNDNNNNNISTTTAGTTITATKTAQTVIDGLPGATLTPTVTLLDTR